MTGRECLNLGNASISISDIAWANPTTPDSAVGRKCNAKLLLQIWRVVLHSSVEARCNILHIQESKLKNHRIGKQSTSKFEQIQ